jgi:Pyocin activator protein PrtN
MVVDERIHTAPTLFLLMTQYNSRTVVQVCRDFFGHLTVEKLLRKALSGDIALPIVPIGTSRKAHATSADRGRQGRKYRFR